MFFVCLSSWYDNYKQKNHVLSFDASLGEWINIQVSTNIATHAKSTGFSDVIDRARRQLGVFIEAMNAHDEKGFVGAAGNGLVLRTLYRYTITVFVVEGVGS